MKQYFFTSIFLLISIYTFAQERYKTEIDLGGGFTLTTFLDFNNDLNQFTLTSPKNADKRVIGGFKSILGRMFGKLPKEGIFVTLNGAQQGDSLIGNGNIAVLGELKFKGIIKGDELSGYLLKDDTISVAKIHGIQTSKKRIDYKNFYPKIVEITQNNIYSKDVLKTKEWKKFQKKLKRLCENTQDDVEFFLEFNLISQNLPFSHYNLIVQQNETEKGVDGDNETSVIFEEKTPETAYLKIMNFSSSQKEIAEVFPK